MSRRSKEYRDGLSDGFVEGTATATNDICEWIRQNCWQYGNNDDQMTNLMISDLKEAMSKIYNRY